MIACDRFCGCRSAPARAGFELVGAGVWRGQGAGYTLVKRRHGWDPVAPDGESVARGQVLPATLDGANAAATKHAREAGHGHP